MARKAFTEHPDFMAASTAASGAIVAAAMRLGVEVNAFELEANVNRVADDLTKFLLRAIDLRDKTKQAA